MASILRSSKFVRYIAGFARNVVINTPREFDGNLVNTSQCLCNSVLSPFSSQTSIQQHDHNIDRSLKRIDQDVRKSGRISKRDIEEVLEEIRINRSATTSQSLLVIRCCGSLVPDELPEIRTKLVEEIWNTLNKLKVPMDVSHYNALLRVYLENEHPFSPMEFLADMKGKGIEPNRVTYQRLIARYCQEGDIEGATNVLEHMRQKEMPVNESVFNALINGHSQAGDMESAHGILSLMAQAGLEPTADTYTTLLCGYARAGDIDAIKRVLTECETKEVLLLDKDFLDICHALAVNGHGKHLNVALSKVRKNLGYNQDAFNAVLNLVNKCCENEAYEILKSMIRNVGQDGEPMPSGGFLLKQLVRAGRPLKTILEMCERLEKDGLLGNTLYRTLGVSLEIGNEGTALAVMGELRKRGDELRQHYFWPLIKQTAKEEGNEGVLRIVREMKALGLNPSSETMRDYVIPSLTGTSSSIIKCLTEADISVGTCSSNLAASLLSQDKIEDAQILMSTVPAYYNPDLLKRPLNQAFYRTQNVESYIKIIREIFENLEKRANVIKEENLEPLDKFEVMGGIIVDLVYSRNVPPELLTKVLEGLKGQGLSISTGCAERVQEKLGDKVTDEIASLLGTLSSGDLTPVSLSRKPPVYTPAHQMNIPQLEKLIENYSTRSNVDTRGLKRQLLTLYYRAKDLAKMESLLEDLKKTPEFFFTGGIYAQIMDLYAHHEDLDNALLYFEKLKEAEGENMKLTNSKVLRLAYVLHKNGRFDEALRLLKETPRDEASGEEDRNFSHTALAWKFLNSLAKDGRVDDLNTLFNHLIDNDYVAVNNVLLGPLIKVHLVKGDVDAALKKFEECVSVYKSTPWKSELACRLIQDEDAEKLQKLTDLSTLVHGEINSLYDLVFAFVECGRIKQARKILETPGLHTRTQRLNHACERYQQEGMVKPLEDLKDATKDLNHIDRTEIYHQLLLSYVKEQNADKALGLWTQMQEEDVPPTDLFLVTLADFLQNQGVDVPFIIPKVNKAQLQHRPKQPPKYETKSHVQTVRSLLRNGQYLESYNYLMESDKQWNLADASELIEKLTQNNDLDRAVTLTLELLARGNAPVSRIFKFHVNKLALAGRVDDIKAIGQKINADVKKLISFDNRLCHAFIVAGKSDEYLATMEKQIDEAKTSDEIKVAGERFPRGGAYGILFQNPQFLQKFEEVCRKYYDKGIAAPTNVLWTYYFVKGEYEKAKEVWNQYLKSSPRIMFQRIVHEARDTNNEELVLKLIDHLKESNVTEGALGNAHSCALDVLVAKDKKEEAIQQFEKALKDVSIDYLNRTAVLRVKNIYDLLGKPFNYKIPEKNKKQITSSSSSSDELEHKQK